MSIITAIGRVASKLFGPVKGAFRKIGTTKFATGAKHAFNKVGSVFNTKAGKIGAATVGVGALTAGSIFAYRKYYSGQADNSTEKKDTVPVVLQPVDNKPKEVKDTVATEKPAQPEEVKDTVANETPAQPEEKVEDKTDKAEDKVEAKEDKTALADSIDKAIGILNEVKEKLNKSETEKTDKAEETDKAEDKVETKKEEKPDKVAETDKAKETDKTDKTEDKVEAKEEEKPDKVAETEKAKETDKAEKGEKAEQAKDYTVVKGDCVWNIAKADLEKQNGTKPTNAQILKRTHEIMELNKAVSEDDKKSGYVALKWEPDNYHVMIRPGDKLKLTA